MDRQGNVPPTSHRQAVRALVIDVPWSSVEPANNAFNWWAIDSKLAAKAARMRVSLRLDTGYRSPSWAKTLSGGAVTIYGTGDDLETYTIPRSWTSPSPPPTRT
jgi:hypothetical protein